MTLAQYEYNIYILETVNPFHLLIRNVFTFYHSDHTRLFKIFPQLLLFSEVSDCKVVVKYPGYDITNSTSYVCVFCFVTYIILEVFTPVMMYVVAFFLIVGYEQLEGIYCFLFLQVMPGMWLVMKKTEENEP